MTMDESAKNIVQDPPDMRVSHRIALWMLILPWGPIAMSFLIVPGHITPFFNHPTAQKFMMAIVVWQAVCCLLAARTNNRTLQFFLAVFSAPLVMGAPMLGPAVITILAAIGGKV